jgi:GAF domain-containing protein
VSTDSITEPLAEPSPETFAAVEESGLLDTPPEPAFDDLTRLAANALRVHSAFVSLISSGRQFFKSSCGLPEPWASQRETPLTYSFCKHVAASDRPLVIKDARRDPLLRESRAVTDLGVIAYAGIPIRDRDGRTLGAFAAAELRPRVWSTEDIEILTALATQASALITARAVVHGLDRVEPRDVDRALHALQLGIGSFPHYGPLTFSQRESLGVLEANFQTLWLMLDRLRAGTAGHPAPESASGGEGATPSES